MFISIEKKLVQVPVGVYITHLYREIQIAVLNLLRFPLAMDITTQVLSKMYITALYFSCFHRPNKSIWHGKS